MEDSGAASTKSSFLLQSTYYYFFKDSPTAMAIADKWGIILETNNRFVELIGALSGSAADIKNNALRLGSSLDFLPVHDVIRFSNLLSKLTEGDTASMDFKTPYKDKNGANHWFRIYAWKMNLDPRVDLSGRGGFIGFIMNDETVEIEIEVEQKLREDIHVAERAMEAKSRFLAMMSHEIRTPIQTIIGMTELLEDSALDSDQGEYARQIKFSADILLSLVNDILDYSKLEEGKMEVERIPFCPAEIIERSVKMLCLEMEKKGLKRALCLDPALKRNIVGDPGKFRQILINLIKNAIKFTPEGSITVNASVALGDQHIRSLTVSVADTGIGIPPEAREKLFTTFMQADSSHTRRFGGTGLGLAICRSMVELMGGTIEMVPNRDGGSIFRFTIPAEEADPNTVIEESDNELRNDVLPGVLPGVETIPPGLLVGPEKLKKNAEKEFLSGSSSVNKVMIVEDHPVNRQLFVMIMEKIGIEVIQAKDGMEALEKADTSPDLIFMDIQMPRMNGYEAAVELRKRGFKNPLIAVTASVLTEEKKLCFGAGFDDILPKPFKRPDIEAILLKWTGRKDFSAGYGENAASDAPGESAISAGSGEKTSSAGHAEKTIPAGSGELLKKPADSTQVFSREDLLDTFMQSEDSAKTLLSHYLERSSRQLNDLPVLIKEENWTEAHRLVHSIKGSARTLSGMELGNAAFVLEKAFKETDLQKIDLQKIESSMPALTEAYERFKSAAEEFLRT